MAVSDDKSQPDNSCPSDESNDTDDSTTEAAYHWRDRDYVKCGDGTDFVYEHQLTACVNNDPYRVFSPHTAVHHQTTFRGDNRSEALSVLTTREHGRVHSRHTSWTEVDGEPRLLLGNTDRQLSEYGIAGD